MKLFLTILIALACLSFKCAAQRNFTFRIDDKEYLLDEKKLNDMFGDSFNALVANGAADNSKFELWVESFETWKNVASNGMWVFELYGNRVAHSTYNGKDVPYQYLGWKAPGKPASGDANKKSNVARRMQFLHGTLSKRIIFYFTQKDVDTAL